MHVTTAAVYLQKFFIIIQLIASDKTKNYFKS